ncbi:MAG: PD-(D/E)XK nuclease family protein [Bacteroidales bacterium]|nr:PD-(D/E)XK nuclease family protein [Bacteroidales bacterium]
MKTFLEITAADLYQRFNGDFSHVTVVFPNKRASLFLNAHLATLSAQPLWSPRYQSISELLHNLSPLQTADPILLVCELHKAYQQVTGQQETLDDFYFWGETLLADFDDIDKNLVDAQRLFLGLGELNRLTNTDDEFLNPEQANALKEFFQNFDIDHRTQLKERFQHIWDSLSDIYNTYRQRLIQQGLASEGMICRNVAEHLDNEDTSSMFPTDQTYVFVGFNVLNQTEHKLFRHLHDRGKALFYWDYDVAYTERTHHEAGEFIGRNLRDFPNALDKQWFDNLRQPKQITIMQASTENAQARYLPQWIGQNLTPVEQETAVVLCNETLLPAVMHSLPDNVGNLNITMGFPLTATQAYAHASGATEAIPLTPPTDSPLETEAAYRIRMIDNRLQTLTDSGTLNLSPTTLQRLRQRIMQSTSIPFHGEPAIGLQVMGVLETRNLDFRHLIMLSVNEGLMPKADNSASVVPYSLRKAFGMTTIDHQTAVYAYYFYRLLQRSERVTLLYNSGESGMNSHEMSRFVLQLLMESNYPISTVTLTTAQSPLPSNDIVIPKTPAIVQRLHDTFNRRHNPHATLSPTALNCYLHCPVEFHYKYIARLQEPDNSKDNQFTTFGTLFHKAAQLLYETPTPDKSGIIDACIERAFQTEQQPNDLLLHAILRKYLQMLTHADNNSKPFTYVASEQPHYMSVSLPHIELDAMVGGTIDRMDRKGDMLRVIDYKTGISHGDVPDMESLFDLDYKQRHAHAFQTFIYASAMCEETTDSVSPTLLYLRKLPQTYTEPIISIAKEPVIDFHKHKAAFDRLLATLLQEIFDPDIPFRNTSLTDHCDTCPYCELCGRTRP